MNDFCSEVQITLNIGDQSSKYLSNLALFVIGAMNFLRRIRWVRIWAFRVSISRQIPTLLNQQEIFPLQYRSSLSSSNFMKYFTKLTINLFINTPKEGSNSVLHHPEHRVLQAQNNNGKIDQTLRNIAPVCESFWSWNSHWALIFKFSSHEPFYSILDGLFFVLLVEVLSKRALQFPSHCCASFPVRLFEFCFLFRACEALTLQKKRSTVLIRVPVLKSDRL